MNLPIMPLKFSPIELLRTKKSTFRGFGSVSLIVTRTYIISPTANTVEPGSPTVLKSPSGRFPSTFEPSRCTSAQIKREGQSYRQVNTWTDRTVKLKHDILPNAVFDESLTTSSTASLCFTATCVMIDASLGAVPTEEKPTYEIKIFYQRNNIFGDNLRNWYSNDRQFYMQQTGTYFSKLLQQPHHHNSNVTNMHAITNIIYDCN